MKRCVIVGSADIHNPALIKSRLREDDFMVFCDGGLRHREALGRLPALVVGDFDSYRGPRPDIETIVLPREKDDTDSVFAVKEALRRGCEEFLLIGAAGGRLDHTLGNVSILLYLDSLGKKAAILDDYSEMEIVSRKPAFIDGSFAYFSLLNVSGTARGITVTGAKYPLDGAEITVEYQYGISNEVLPGKTACVSLAEGRLLLVKIFAEG